MPKGLYIPYAKRVKEAVDVPVICAGRMDNPDLALDAINSGACDIIGLGRPLLADPEYVNKLRAGKRELTFRASPAMKDAWAASRNIPPWAVRSIPPPVGSAKPG